MSTETDRLRAIHDELNGILEERVTDLLAHVKAVRQVTQQVTAAELDIRRHQQIRAQLEADGQGDGEIGRKVEVIRDTIARIEAERDDLLGTLSGLTAGLKGLSGAS